MTDSKRRPSAHLIALGLIASSCAALGIAACGSDEPLQMIEITVPPGTTFDSVLDTLVTRGVVAGGRRFRLYARLIGADRRVR